MSCPYGCNPATGACQSFGGHQCSAGETRCVSGSLVQHCAGGQWGPIESCPGGCDPIQQACASNGQCTDGERRCHADGEHVQFCEQGDWGSQVFCAYGCDSASADCRTSSPNCQGSYPAKCDWAGARTCNAFGDVLTCDFNDQGCLAWQVSEQCTDGCSGGACTGNTCSGPDVCSVPGAGRCADAGRAEVCQLSSDGCLRWTAPVGGGQCGAGEVCKAGVCTTQSCQQPVDCWESSRSCQTGLCQPCDTNADCGGAPWVCSQTTKSCYAAF